MFVYKGDHFDYSYRECIASLKACCDQVVVLAIESDDGSHVACKNLQDYKTKVIVYEESAWHAQRPKYTTLNHSTTTSLRSPVQSTTLTGTLFSMPNTPAIALMFFKADFLLFR